MENWNKYGFLEDLKNSLVKAVEDNYLDNIDSIHDFIGTEIDNAIIYYSDCWDIAKELHLTDFTDFEFGTATGIQQLAEYGLYEYIQNEFDYKEIEDLIDQKNAE